MNLRTTYEHLKRIATFFARSVLKPKVVQIHNKKIIMDYRGWSPEMIKIFFWDNYELEERTIVPAILRPGDRVLEIGSAVGFIGMLASDIVGTENVFMVEANPELIKAARRNLELNNVSAHLIHGAVVPNASTESIPFHIHENFWSSSLGQKDGTKQTLDVTALPLPDLIERHQPNVLIIDIEGAEYDLLTQLSFPEIDKICVEVHARYIGDEKISALIRHLILDGFDLVQSISTGDNLYFQKTSRES